MTRMLPLLQRLSEGAKRHLKAYGVLLVYLIASRFNVVQGLLFTFSVVYALAAITATRDTRRRSQTLACRAKRAAIVLMSGLTLIASFVQIVFKLLCEYQVRLILLHSSCVSIQDATYKVSILSIVCVAVVVAIVCRLWFSKPEAASDTMEEISERFVALVGPENEIALANLAMLALTLIVTFGQRTDDITSILCVAGPIFAALAIFAIASGTELISALYPTHRSGNS